MRHGPQSERGNIHWWDPGYSSKQENGYHSQFSHITGVSTVCELLGYFSEQNNDSVPDLSAEGKIESPSSNPG